MTARSQYSVSRVEGVLCLCDEHGPKSVTNDIEEVVRDLHASGQKLFPGFIYRDSEGNWDAVLVSKDGEFIGFEPISIRDVGAAVLLFKRWFGRSFPLFDDPFPPDP